MGRQWRSPAGIVLRGWQGRVDTDAGTRLSVKEWPRENRNRLCEATGSPCVGTTSRPRIPRSTQASCNGAEPTTAAAPFQNLQPQVRCPGVHSRFSRGLARLAAGTTSLAASTVWFPVAYRGLGQSELGRPPGSLRHAGHSSIERSNSCRVSSSPSPRWLVRLQAFLYTTSNVLGVPRDDTLRHDSPLAESDPSRMPNLMCAQQRSCR